MGLDLSGIGEVLDDELCSDVIAAVRSAVHRAVARSVRARTAPPDVGPAWDLVTALGERGWGGVRSPAGGAAPVLFTLRELEGRTGVPASTLRRWVASGWVPGGKFRTKWLALLEDVERFKERDRR